MNNNQKQLNKQFMIHNITCFAYKFSQELGINITRVNPVHLSREHQDEYVECSCKTEKEKELIRMLQSHGAMKVKLLPKDDGSQVF